MLYLQNTQEAQFLLVPRNGEIPEGDLTFKAKSTIDLTLEMDLQVVNLDVSALYLHLAVIVPDGCPVGEYEYSVQVGDQILSTGLLVVGELNKPSEYEKTIQYEQYEA
jgi:hypothetical protein